MKTEARSITSNQVGVHEDLQKHVLKHQQNVSRRPIAEHTKQAFQNVLTFLDDWKGEVILDACCGVGESTIGIASQHPEAKVIGIDKSIARLDKHQSYAKKQALQNSSYFLAQADLNDFWRLLLSYIEDYSPAWTISKQFILYPNPYPKKSQLSKRWHASAMFPCIMALSSYIELRSNWRVYLEEFAQAAKSYGLKGEIILVEGKAMTPFERKYMQAQQACYQLLLTP